MPTDAPAPVRRAAHTPAAMLLHWLVAAAVAIVFCTRVLTPDPGTGITAEQLGFWHRWAGLALPPLTLAWLVARGRDRRRPHAAGAAARLVHGALFALLLAAPLSAWAGAAVHAACAWLLLGALALHLCGAVHAALTRDDGVALRMFPEQRPDAG